MTEHMTRMFGGPGSLRFFLQPAVAILLGILHGLRDHRAGRPVYLVGLISARGKRLQRLGEGLRDIAVPLTVALVASYTFQYIIRRHVYIGYGLLYAALFVAVPYFASRGVANRLAHRRFLARRT